MTANLLVDLYCSVLQDPALNESNLEGSGEIVSILLGHRGHMKDTDGPMRSSQGPSAVP